MVSPGWGFPRRIMQSIRGRGVKYCPAPDFFSAAFFSSRPSYRLPRPSSRAENQSSLSIASVSDFRLVGLRRRRDIFVFGVGPGAAEIGVRVAQGVQLQPERLELSTR